MKTKRDRVDAVFSKLIRERANWKCEDCGADHSERKQSLHCSHFFSRRKRGIRFSPRNACAQCFTCHQRAGENPLLFAKWIESYLTQHYGEDAFQELFQKQNEVFKLTKPIKEDIYRNLKDSLSWMEQQRREGREGRIEFDSPYEL